MTSRLSPLQDTDVDSGIDRNDSPLASIDTTTTPDTEISPPYSPLEPNGHFKDKRLLAKKKLAQLSQEEKV